MTEKKPAKKVDKQARAKKPAAKPEANSARVETRTTKFKRFH